MWVIHLKETPGGTVQDWKMREEREESQWFWAGYHWRKQAASHNSERLGAVWLRIIPYPWVLILQYF